ncbi:MAG: hypothetical protein WC099_03680 [Candidatus Paceibacterota bacterium]
MNKKYIFIFSITTVCIAIMCGVWFAWSSFENKKTEVTTDTISVHKDDARVQKAKENIRMLQESLAKNPQSPEIKRSLSRAFFLSGDSEQAQYYITEALTQKSDDPQYYIDLGVIYVAQNEILKAEEQFLKAISLFREKGKTSQENTFYSVSSKGDISMTKQAVIFEKLSIPVVAYARLADIYLRQNKPQEVIALLEEGVTLSPQYPDFYKILSQAYQQLHDVENESKNQKIFEKLTSFNTRS